MDFSKISNYLKAQHQPSFRLKQIKEAYFKQHLSGFNQISSLPKDSREDLALKFPWLLVKPAKQLGSLDRGSLKALLVMPDGLKTESVLIAYEGWITACLSVSVGCSLGCSFCATGQMGFKRNLNSFEIVDQVVYWNQILKERNKRVSRVVLMGMGEPFLNWENTWEAIKIINSKDGLNLGQRHITISTAGVVQGIKMFTDLKTQINLAISLHTPFQEKREEIMPIARKYKLDDLMESAKDYVRRTKRKLFFEYALISGFNDRPEDATELKKLFTEPLFQLNLIKINPTKAKFSPASQNRLTNFTRLLEKNHIPFTLRRSLGAEIQAACGQLAGE
jgi:23S rRNA (adenine2503-C2)-methyltransferase